MKKHKQTKMAMVMSLAPMLFTMGCGLPPVETDAVSTSRSNLVMEAKDAAIQKKSKLQLRQGPQGLVTPKESLTAIQPTTLRSQPAKLKESPKPMCGVLVPVREPGNKHSPDSEERSQQELQDQLNMDWDVLSNQPGMPIFVYINLNNQDVKWVNQEMQGLEAAERTESGQLRLRFQGHHKPGNYTKTFTFQHNETKYKLPLCYTVN